MSKSYIKLVLTAVILVTSLATAVGVGYAQDGGGEILIEGATTGTCGEINFTFSWEGGAPPYLVSLNYGNEDYSGHIQVDSNTFTIDYSYLDQGDYAWSFTVEDVTVDGDSVIFNGINGSFSEILTLEGPEVTLSSSPFPPLFVVGDAGVVDFSTVVTGGTIIPDGPPYYTYAWDLDGDGIFESSETGETATGTYTELGKSYPQVQVTDGCSFTDSDTMPVVVADPENACHPMAQKISDGVNTIFPDQSGDLYTCEDVYALFNNESEENNLGFGRMWKAYHLAESMEELTWEDILDWHLNESGWGSLLQLDRFADLLEDHDLPELMGLVMSEEYSLGDVRTAVRSVTRYEADFEDVLARILDGASTGELGQLYKLAADLETDVEVLDGFLADGLTLAELKHASKFADRVDADWEEIANARSEADSWKDLKQAYTMASEETSAAEILIMGVQVYKESLREKAKADREVQRTQQQEDKTQQTAEKLAEQFSAKFGDVMSLFNGECEGDWACVRSTLRTQNRETSEGKAEKDLQIALQIRSKYGFTEEEVLAYHKVSGEDWTHTRAHFRELYMSTKQTGKPNK